MIFNYNQIKAELRNKKTDVILKDYGIEGMMFPSKKELIEFVAGMIVASKFNNKYKEGDNIQFTNGISELLGNPVMTIVGEAVMKDDAPQVYIKEKEDYIYINPTIIDIE